MLQCSINMPASFQARSRDPRAGVSSEEFPMADPQSPATPAVAKNGAGAANEGSRPAEAAAEAARSAVDAAARQAQEGAQAAEALADTTADASRAAAKANSEILRTQIETAEQAVRSGLEAGMRSFEGMTQNWTRAFGAAAPNVDLADQSAKNVQAVSQASTALAKSAQDASRAWFELTQKAVRTNLDAMGQFAGCRSVQDLMTVQSNLVRDNLQQAIESGELIARASSEAIREATRAMRPPSV
jgi:hypothetical protein